MLTFLLYGLLVVLTLVRFERPVRLSAFERERLAAQGDDTARSEKHILHKLPLVLSVQRLATSLVTVGFIAAALFSLGWWGSAVAVAGLLLLPLVYRVTPLRRAGKKLGEVLWPVTEKVTEWLQPVVHALRPLDVRPAPPRLHSVDELDYILSKSPGIMTPQQERRLAVVLAKETPLITTVMTPREHIAAVPADETLGPLILDELYKTGHDHFPVYEDDIDHIVGVLYVRDLLTVDTNKASSTVASVMDRQVCYARDDYTLDQALSALLQSQKILLVVVNDDGETEGVATLSEVLSAYVGQSFVDIFDQHTSLHAVVERQREANSTKDL